MTTPAPAATLVCLGLNEHDFVTNSALLSIPTYASACSGSVRYSSACSCIGAGPCQVTYPIIEYSLDNCVAGSEISGVIGLQNGECLDVENVVAIKYAPYITTSCDVSDCHLFIYQNGDTNCNAENLLNVYEVLPFTSGCGNTLNAFSSMKLVFYVR